MAGRFLFALVLVLGTLGCVQSEFASSSGKVQKESDKQQAADQTPVDAGSDGDDQNETGSDDLGSADDAQPVVDEPIETKADNAVTKGSFTAWAVPPNPKPRESYWIHVEVKLPANTQNYTQADLAGTVIGTDLYERGIGRNSNGPGGLSTLFGEDHPDTFNFSGDKATIAVWVPGAEALVRDTIKIRSDLLNEEQSLEIVFQ